MKRFADIVEEVRALSPEEKEELSEILNRSRIEERRKEILQNHDEAMKEYSAGKLKSYDNAEDIINALNED